MRVVDDEAMLTAFIDAARRDRWRAGLSNPRRRRATLDRLNHCCDLDERYTQLLPSDANVAALLRQRDAPATCYALSDVADIDGRTMPLDEAIAAAGGWGTILSCRPGRLAYYYDERGDRRMLLERPPR